MTHPKTTKPMTKLSLRKVVLAMMAITVVFAFSSCSKDSKNIKIFKDAAMKLDESTLTLEYEYDYWPTGGIRNIGGHLASLISLNDLEKMLPCPLYVSGPHKNGEWDLYSNDFGHYNPEAIQYLADLAEKVVSDKNFVKLSRPFVDRYLGTQMKIMMVMHDVMYDEDLFSEEGRDIVFNEIVENYGYCEPADYINSNLNLDDDENIFYNFNSEMLQFWSRRWVDGSINQFYDALSTVYKAYYPDYEYSTDQYWLYYEWGDGDYDDYYEETFYSVDLEPDEPVTDAERIKEKDAIEMIKTATEKLDKSFNVIENGFDYWPECGLRNTASHLFSLISLRTVNRMLPCNLYLYDGPHYNNRWDFNNPWTFGYYNPEAIKYLNKLAKQIVSDKKFVDRTRPLVDEYMKRQLFFLKSIYDALNDPKICPDKEAVLQEMLDNSGFIWEDGPTTDLMDQLDLEDGTYVWGNTGNMFLYWWARRWADDTMELFHEGLETIYNAYYPAE